MVERPAWRVRLEEAWQRRPIVWLSGVRRVGKTTLARMLPDIDYLNCDLPSVQRALADPELFLGGVGTESVLVFDEVHRLADPSGLLKIAADEHPELRVLATGSSTLAATAKFRDSLTGRKQEVHLCPVPWSECVRDFGVADLDRRLLHGGLPEPLLATEPDASFFAEWIDSFYARDILELFHIRNREGFLSLFRLLLRQSGGQVDHTSLASLSELSRPTVKSHMEAMRVAHAIRLLRPFHGGGKREVTSRPKCYAFDTGFVAFERGWGSIRAEDRGLLWEHMVLDEILTRFRESDLFYWQDKSRREVDFVIRRGETRVDTVECKINPDRFDAAATEVFRAAYPDGENFIVTPRADRAYRIRRGELEFTVCSAESI